MRIARPLPIGRKALTPFPPLQNEELKFNQAFKALTLQIWDISDQQNVEQTSCLIKTFFLSFFLLKRENRRLIAAVAEMFFQVFLGPQEREELWVMMAFV